MATYSTGLYGELTYGSSNTSLVQLSVPTFSATSYNYGSILLEWGTPSDSSWSKFLLLRNALGFPVTPDDGELLLSMDSLESNSLIDTGAYISPVPELDTSLNVLGDGKIYYYSIFLLDSTSAWQRAGNAIGLSAKNYSTTELMHDYLPLPYRSLSTETVDSDGYNADLLSFLKTFGFTYDVLKTYVDNAKYKHDVANVHGALIPNLLYQFGFSFEDNLGIQQGRRLVNSASNIYLKKGSTAGLKTFVSAFTGFNTYVAPVKNLLLTLDAGSFENTLDGWTTNTSNAISAITGSAESPAVTPYAESGSPVGYPNSTSKILKAVRTAGISGNIIFNNRTYYKNIVLLEQTPILANGTTVTLTTASNHGLSVGQTVVISGVVPAGYNGTVTVTAINAPNQFSYANTTTGNIITSGTAAAAIADPKKAGIPVSGGTEYTFSIYSRAKTDARTVETNIFWYDVRGALISFSSTGSGTNSTSSWSRAGTVTATAPVNAAYAAPVVTVLGAQPNEVHYFDAAQFEKSSSATTYADPRRIDIYLQANRINEVKNPSFEVNTTYWEAQSATLSRVSGGALTGSSWSAKVTSSSTTSSIRGDTTTPATYNYVSVIPGVEHTLSVYLKTANTASADLKITWRDSSGSNIGTTTESISSISSSWTRYYATKIAPTNAATALVSIFFYGASGDEYFVDAVLFERATGLNQYFDGDTGYYIEDDLLWEDGLTGLGRSLYYKNRLAATSRLNSVISDYIPIGSLYAIFVGKTVA